MFDILWRFLNPPPSYEFNFEEAKRRCRIALVDDDSNALPLDDLKSHDYNIEHFKKVDVPILNKLEDGRFDIIVLDYNGIAPPEICPNDGFGIFDRIRLANPQQYIISISGQTYDIVQSDYFNKSNDRLGKPTDLTSTKTKIDKAIKELFDKTLVIQKIAMQLRIEGIDNSKIQKVEKYLAQYTVNDADVLSEKIRKLCKIEQLSKDVTGIARKCARLAAP